MWSNLVFSAQLFARATVISAQGREALNALATWTIDLLSENPDVDLCTLPGAPATLAVTSPTHDPRVIPLLITEAAYLNPTPDGHHYRLELEPPIAPLALRRGHRIFQNKTTREIADTLLRDFGVPSSDISYRLAGRYPTRIYCVQYAETELDFLKRILADDGISFWFDADPREDSKSLIVFGDGFSAHDAIPGDIVVPFDEASGASHPGGAFFELRHTLSIAHDRVHLRDYDVRAPDVLIEGTAGKGPLEYFDYPAGSLHTDAAAARAQVRLDQLRRERSVLRGASTCGRLRAGRIVRIEGADDDGVDGDYLIVEVEHTFEQASRGTTTTKPYRNRVVLVPTNGGYYRPAIPTVVPKIPGVETGVVTGPKGEEIHVDDLGRIKIRSPWDRSGVGDDKSSCWVRTLQIFMHDSMILPRVGWEVPIVYMDGNPDHPFALGRLYNGGAPMPYDLPARKATYTIQSATSPSNGSTQEIRFDDDKGSMQAFIHATKDQSVSVGGAHHVTVGANEAFDVAKSYAVHVTGSQSLTVAGKQGVTVGADAGITVHGGRSESIAGAENIGVVGACTVHSGPYKEAIAVNYNLTCNQSNTVAQGTFTQIVVGLLKWASGLGTNQSVVAARTETVMGARTVSSAGAFADSVKGAKRITAGAAKDSAGSHIKTQVAGVASVKVGSASLTSGQVMAVEANSISIKVAGGLTLAGGTTTTLSGKLASEAKAKFDAPKTKRTNKSELGS